MHGIQLYCMYHHKHNSNERFLVKRQTEVTVYSALNSE